MCNNCINLELSAEKERHRKFDRTEEIRLQRDADRVLNDQYMKYKREEAMLMTRQACPYPEYMEQDLVRRR